MTRTGPVKLALITEFCKHQPRLIKRGENGLSSGHVKSMVFDGRAGVLTGKVQASFSSHFYEIKIAMKVRDNGSLDYIKEGSCTCVKGAAVCHHMLALLLHAHYSLSCTDVAQKWDRPSKRADKNSGQKVTELFTPSRPTYRAITQPLSQGDFDFAYRTSGMCGDGAAGAIWLLGPAPDSTDLAIISVTDFISGQDFLASHQKGPMLNDFLKVTWDEIINISRLTTGQRRNHLWLKARLCRITASKFSDVLRAVEKNRKPCQSLMKSFLESKTQPETRPRKPPRPGSGLHALYWGQDNEDVASSQFQAKTGLKVQDTGLWLHPSGKLGASPDGLVGCTSLLEVKCPYKIRDGETVKESIHLMGNNYIVSYDSTADKFTVNEDHEYYHQIQGQLFLTRRSLCYLVIWISKDFVIVEVPRNGSWGSNIPKLLHFYDKFIVPQLTR
ncbi:Alkaline nuclease [Frankliniella fusca]|uniref:Alkaline nuclease n=1 Tax=Frankliniella fusca TaxID=407009 RepID=A0AAE1GRC7_9NEOP|nr:Alkaline nuclease [Frankliniella fusca]